MNNDHYCKKEFTDKMWSPAIVLYLKMMFHMWENRDIEKLDDEKIASHIKELLIDKFNIVPNFVDENREYSTPAFILAAKMDLPHTLKMLLDNGANINIRGDIDNTALMSAAFCNNHEIVLILIHRGAEINAIDDGGANAIDYAMIENEDNCLSVRILYKNGLNPSNDFD